MALGEPEVGAAEGPFQAVRLPTSRGDVELRHYPAAGSPRAALFVGGVGGGFDTPGRGRLKK